MTRHDLESLRTQQRRIRRALRVEALQARRLAELEHARAVARLHEDKEKEQ